MNYEYYTNQEKSILINFFIKEGKNCNIEFKNYLESFVTKYGKKIYDKHPLRRVTSILDELGNYEYESPLYIWENEKNDNLVTYVFSHPGFVMTTGKIKNLKKLKVNWNHLNNEGENFLFHVKMQKIEQLKELIQNEKVKTDLLNNSGEVFYFNIFKNHKSISKNMSDCSLEDINLNNVINLIFENCELMNLMEKSKIEEFKKSFHDCLNIIEKKLYEIAKRENKNFPKSYEEDFNNDCLFFKEHRLYLDKIFNYYILNKKLIFDESKIKVKKNKI